MAALHHFPATALAVAGPFKGDLKPTRRLAPALHLRRRLPSPAVVSARASMAPAPAMVEADWLRLDNLRPQPGARKNRKRKGRVHALRGITGVFGAAPSPMSAVDGLVDAAGGCAVIDGGLSTQLEAHGAVFDETLWSAICLHTSPHLIKKVHLEYLEAGADVIITASYQATIDGFLSKGISIEDGEELLQKSVKLAIEARDEFWRNVHHISNHSYHRTLVAASVGSYGAYLADGSEYRGNYGPSVTLDMLKNFHRRRLQVLLAAKPDMLAFETIPNKLEAKACSELLEEENVQIPSMICFSCVDGEHMASGETFKDCLDILNKNEKVKVVGINCTPPQFIEDLISRFNKLTDKHIAVYPNSGEIWDGECKKWMPSSCLGDEKFVGTVQRWHKLGASLIGGCCRTTPSTIRGISKALKENN